MSTISRPEGPPQTVMYVKCDTCGKERPFVGTIQASEGWVRLDIGIEAVDNGLNSAKAVLDFCSRQHFRDYLGGAYEVGMTPIADVWDHLERMAFDG